jgi:hypothetical protein
VCLDLSNCALRNGRFGVAGRAQHRFFFSDKLLDRDEIRILDEADSLARRTFQRRKTRRTRSLYSSCS